MSSLYSPYSGRLADICDEFYDESDDTQDSTDTSGRFVEGSMVLLWIGRCLEDLANDGLFKTSTQIDIVADQTEYNLLTLIPRLVKADLARKTSAADWLVMLTDQALYAMAKQYASEWGTGKVGFIRGTKLYLVDAPTETTTEGLEIYYSYYPPYAITLSNTAAVNNGDGTVKLTASDNELEVGDKVMIYGTTNYDGTHEITAVTEDTFSFTDTYVAETIPTAAICRCEPRTPLTNDTVFTNYCLWRRSLKDRKSSTAKQDIALYSGRYQIEKNKLLTAGKPPILKVRR